MIRQIHMDCTAPVAFVTLDNNDLLNLVDSPIEAVPAQGLGTSIFVLGGCAAANTKSGAYTGFSGYNSVFLSLPGTSTASIRAQDLLGGQGYSVSNIFSGALIGAGDFDGEIVTGASFSEDSFLSENQPLMIAAQNGDGNFSGGHDDNWATFVI